MIEPLITGLLLLFVRVSAFVAFLPLFGGTRLPATVKIGLAVALTLTWANFSMPSAAGGSAFNAVLLAWLIGREATLGAGIGWLFGMVFIPMRIAGSFIAQEMGLTIATLTSSADNGSSNVLSEILDALAVLLFLSINGHHWFFRGMQHFLQVYPVGGNWSIPDQLKLSQWITSTPTLGLHLALPVAMLLLGTTLSLLFIMRQTPQFNLFNFGMPVRLLAGLLALALFLPDLIHHTLVIFHRAFLLR